MMILKVQDVTKSFNGREVLSGLSFDLKDGEWLGILGESGSGKSTLLKILGRFLDADSGKVYLKGKKLPDVADQLIPGMDEIKLIHQEFELFPNQTTYENVAYALRFYDPVYKAGRVTELLQLTGLEKVMDQRAKILSGGEKQRTAIARALAETPQVLLLDEPFAHLDNANRYKLTRSIERIRKEEHMACLLVTHEASEALAWSDRLIILKKGEIVQVGTPREVYENPRDAYVAELTGTVNWLEEGKAFIRPEKLKVTPHAEKSKWVGKVSTKRFRGSYWEYGCINASNEFLFYRQKNDIHVGEKVMLRYTQRDIVRFS
jgi:ABC-type Fe3+/spermidine/putrescine transport system ATPase subunit